MKKATWTEDNTFLSPGNGGQRENGRLTIITLRLLLVGSRDPDAFVKSSGTHPPPRLVSEMAPYVIE